MYVDYFPLYIEEEYTHFVICFHIVNPTPVVCFVSQRRWGT